MKRTKLSAMHKKRIAIAMTGKILPEEVRKKISENHADILGKKNPFFGKKHSKKARKKISLAAIKQGRSKGKNNYFYGLRLTGEKNGNWRGGLSFEPYTPEFNGELKRRIRTRDDFMCQFCGTKENGGKLPVHHIDYSKSNNDDFNLITLCKPHNAIANFNRDKWQFLFEVIQELRRLPT